MSTVLDRLLAGLLVVPFALGTAAAPDEEEVASEVVFTFADGEIVESSGLAVVDDLVVTTNDSGDTGRVFAVDPATGETVGTTAWSSEPSDVEALAPAGRAAVWVGDIGDNLERRESVQVSEVPVARGERDADAPVYDLVYPDGPHDAETLVSHPVTGRLYVATKSPLGGVLYAAPEELDPRAPNRLEPVGDVLPIATDGTFLPDGRLVVRNYAAAAVYDFPSLEKVADLSLPAQLQGEGVAADADGSLLVSTEGVGTEVLRVAGPPPPADAAASAPATAVAPSASPSPRPTVSREDVELPDAAQRERPAWPWFFGGLMGLAVIVVLGWSLRRP